jgi:hypothetical protein
MADKAPAAEPAPGSKRDDFDVVLVHGSTDDGQGAKVLRGRPGRIEAGEVRPMADGRPMIPGAEVVRLEPRKEAPAFYDVHVEYEVPSRQQAPATARGSGPAQVATAAYRASWERTFGPPRIRRSPPALKN